MVQRRTISIPDELDARLERLQDRINISKVCAEALERELAMLEGAIAIDPAVERALSRLQTAADAAYQRGYEHGRLYAAEQATRQQMFAFCTWPKELTELTGEEGALVKLRDDTYRAARDSIGLDGVDLDAYRNGWLTAAREVGVAVTKVIKVGPVLAPRGLAGSEQNPSAVEDSTSALTIEDAERILDSYRQLEELDLGYRSYIASRYDAKSLIAAFRSSGERLPTFLKKLKEQEKAGNPAAGCPGLRSLPSVGRAMDAITQSQHIAYHHWYHRVNGWSLETNPTKNDPGDGTRWLVMCATKRDEALSYLRRHALAR